MRPDQGPAAPVLVDLVVSGPVGPWGDAGFSTADDTVTIGPVLVRAAGTDQPAGVQAWGLTGVEDGVVDGLLTLGRDGPRAADPVDHPNTAVAIDHVVVASPDLDRTAAALAAVGVERRRVRDAGRMEQHFFRLGAVILEVVGRPGARGPGPATFWGLALTAADLDAAAALLGDHLGPITPAVQPGRRIATLRHEALGLPVPVALLSPPPPRSAPTSTSP